MSPSKISSDLDLVLDRISIEYPALVMETFLSISKEESIDGCASMANGFCWMVSKHNIFVWSAEECGSCSTAVQLPLPPSGLPYSAKFVVVYEINSRSPPGVLVVSGEGVARHWPCLLSSIHDEVVIDLASEVTLAVHFLERTSEGTSFVLTTTSGSVYLIHGSGVSMRGKIQFSKVGSREFHGIGKRFSNIIFGSPSSAVYSSHVTNALIFRGNASSNSSYAETIVATISPNTIRAYDIRNKNVLRTINIRTVFEQLVMDYFQRPSKNNTVANLNVWLLDAAIFRDGILLLLAGNHDKMSNLSIFLAYTRFNISALTDVMWFSNIPVEQDCLREFEVSNESSFIGRIFLCVPGRTSNSSSCERTDGIIILYPQHVQSVYLPNHFNKHTSPSLNKILSFPTGTKLVGHACDKRFCYVMTVHHGICCVRLLPRGFDDDLKNEKFLMDDLLDIKDSISREDKSLGVLVSAFSSFAAKNIIGADETMKPLLKRSNNDLTAVIYDFLKIIIDRPVGCNPEMELTRKKVICNRILLFLKHMGVYDKVASTKLLLYNQRHSRTGVSILSEMSERVYVAIALRDWEVVREDRAEILEQITKRLAQISNVHYGYDSMLYSTLSIIHNLPAACAETIRELLEKAVDKAAKRRLVQLCADMLLTFSNAIDSYRRDASSVVVPQCDVQWTTGVVSDAYSVVCKILLKELKSTEASQTDKIGLRDSIVRLIIFHLSECGEQIDGHELIMALYDLGERKLAVELAERFQDFKVLVEACLQLDQTERRAKLEAYKLRYSAEEFDLYLCRYLKQKNLNELLLEEKGERVDRYLLSCEEIRWRRELQNNQFEQASRSLLSLADRESSNIDRQKSLYAFAKLAAACTIVEPSDIIRECTKKLLLIKHQLLVPESLIKRVYSDNPYQPLTAAELIELNLIDEDIVEGHKRALYLLATLLQDNGSAEIRSEVAKIWISLLKCTNWNQVATVYEVADTPFGSVLRSIGDDDDSLESLQLVLPCSDTLIRDCKKELSTNEFAPKWVRAAIDRTVSTIRTKLGERENEAKKKKSVSLTVPRMPDLFGCRSLPRSDKHEYVMAQ